MTYHICRRMILDNKKFFIMDTKFYLRILWHILDSLKQFFLCHSISSIKSTPIIINRTKMKAMLNTGTQPIKQIFNAVLPSCFLNTIIADIIHIKTQGIIHNKNQIIPYSPLSFSTSVVAYSIAFCIITSEAHKDIAGPANNPCIAIPAY